MSELKTQIHTHVPIPIPIPKGTSSILFIPRLLPHITEEHIFNTLYNLNLGIITKIDIKKQQKQHQTKEQKNKNICKKAYIHISEWFNTENAFNAYSRLSNNQEIKVIYDEYNWYWKIVMYKDPPNKPKTKHNK